MNLRSVTCCLLLLPALAAWSAPAESTSENQPAGERSPRASYWELLFDDGISAKEYARQLDYFKIELAADDGKGQIQYASAFGKPRPERRLGSREHERRMSIRWKKGTLVAVDRKLLGRAGIHTQGKQLLHYLPTQLENQLGKLEHAYAHRAPEQIARTRFKIRERAAGDGYEFYVDEQDEKPDSPGNGSSQSAATSAP